LSFFGSGFLIKTLNTFISIAAFYYFLNTKHSYFLTGFFIGVFWFWWIGLSFRYYNLTYFIPVVILFIGTGYGIIFWIIEKIFSKFNFLFINSKILWALFLIFGFDFVSPFTFDWLKPEVLISNSFFTPYKTTLFLILIAVILKNYISIILIISALLIPMPKIPKTPLKINLITTYIPQDKKWDPKFIPIEIKNNFRYIKNSIGKYDAVVLPESAFPVFLNRHADIMKKLKHLSSKITIVTGALHEKNGNFYNSTYVFENGKVTIVDKHILVPFGEYIPLPFFQKEINKIFFSDASDYKTSPHFSTFKIKNTEFINAICYEATVKEVYKLKPNFIIALSNMAWFMPSTAPVLQKLLINVYVVQYKKRVYHSLNYFPSYILPKE